MSDKLSNLSARQNSRLIGRLSAEMQLGCLVAAARALSALSGGPVRIERAIYLVIILRLTGRFYHEATGTADRMRDAASGISINALALSLNRPFETARRHISSLISDGICTRGREGVSISAAALRSPEMVAMLEQLHDIMVTFVDQLAGYGLTPVSEAANVPYAHDATIAAACDLTLISLEYIAPYYSSWLEFVVVHAIMAAGSRQVVLSRELSRRYSEIETVPPDDMRSFIRTKALSDALLIPYSTLRRQVDQSALSGLVERGQGGVRATTAHLQSLPVTGGAAVAAARTARAFERLGSSGFRFNDPASCYIHGPVPYLSFRDN